MKQYIFDYALNKFCPLVIVGALAFSNMGFQSFEPYIIIAMMLYGCNFNYKVGYSVGICEKNNLL